MMNNYPTFYTAQANKKRKEQLIIISSICIFLFLGLVVLGVGYVNLSNTNQTSSVAFINSAYASANIQENNEVNNLVDVVAPLVDIEAQTKITLNMLTKKKIPAEYANNAIVDYNRILGQYAKEKLYSGVAIQLTQVTNQNTFNNIVAQIPAGYRAVTITLTPTKSIEGWLQAGTNVDVYWISSQNGKSRIAPIVQNAYVLSADRLTVEGKKNAEKNGKEIAAIPVTASLLVTKDDALKIGLASSYGTITLSLRGDDEKEVTTYNVKGMTTADLLHIKENKSEKIKASIKMIDKNGKVQKYYLKDDKLVPIA